MDAKQTSAILFFAEAVAASPTKIRELIKRVLLVFDNEESIPLSLNELFKTLSEMNSASSVDDIVLHLKDSQNENIKVFIQALRDIQNRNKISYTHLQKRNLEGLETFKNLSLDKRLQFLRNMNIIDNNNNLTSAYGGNENNILIKKFIEGPLQAYLTTDISFGKFIELINQECATEFKYSDLYPSFLFNAKIDYVD